MDRHLRPALLRIPITLALLLGLLLPTLASADPAPLTCQAVPRLVGMYLQNHVEFRSVSKELQGRVADLHIERLDPARALLLQSDADSLRAAHDGIFGALARQDCGLLQSMQQLILERYRTMEAYVRDYVSRDDYQIDRSATLVIDPKERGFPKTAEQREDLWRRLVHFQMSNYVSNGTSLEEAKKKLVHRYELLTRRAEEMQPADVYEQFLEAFSRALDPHSDYLSAESLEDFRIHMGLSLEGIGAVLSSRDGYTVVEEIVPGGAADKQGQLHPKDRIVSVGQGDDGEPVDVIDMDLRDVVRLIRGHKGSVVRLGVIRQEPSTEKLTVRLVRDKIDLDYQAAKLRFEEVPSEGKNYKLAILDLPSFYGDKNPENRQATRDVSNLLRQVRAEKADGLVLDLSRNSGGLLDYAVEITGFFIESGGVVAIAGSDDKTQVLEDPDAGIQYDGPLVVLTSRVTASAGEILAGAIKDYHRGLLVGDDHTFGKGSVQTVAPLPPGLGAIKLTTALFYRPGGQSTQQSGVKADIVIPSLTTMDDFGESQQPYSLPGRSIPAFLHPSSTPTTWRPVSAQIVPMLAKRSSERVAANEKFVDIEKRVEEAKASDGVVRVSDLLDEDGKPGKGAEQKTDAALGEAPPGAAVDPAEETTTAKADEPPSPQLEEALQILADWVALQHVALN
jgi:carboxyl-terminal processing protease